MKTQLLLGSTLAVLLGAMPITAAAQEDATTVGDVIVSGEKTDRSLQETTTSVQVIGEQQIEDEQLADLYDVYDRAANVNARYGTYGVVIRGIEAFNVSGAGTGSLASIYLDDVALSRRAVESGPLQVWDAEQIELLRGPQSTLQGRNALAGAIIVRTRAPSFEWGGRGRIIVADDSRKEIAFAGGGPIVTDQLAFRVAAENVTSDGLIFNPTRNEDANFRDSRTYRGRLLFLPSAAPNLSVEALYLHNRSSSGEERSSITASDFWTNRVNPSNDPGRFDLGTDMGSLQIGLRLSDRIKLKSITGWSEDDYRAVSDGDLTPTTIERLSFNRQEEILTQEFRANLDFGRLTGVAGAYAMRAQFDDRSDNRLGISLAEAGVISLLTSPPYSLPLPTANAIAGLYPARVPLDTTTINPGELDNYALFADGAYAVNDRLTILAGVRFDRETQDRANTTTASLGTTLPNPASFPGLTGMVVGGINAYINGQVAAANAAQVPVSDESEAFLPKLGLRYEWTADLSTSFVVQRGYRPGGGSTNYARGLVVAFDPEYTWNYEAGLRSSWRDGRFIFNANAFYVDWQDQQVTVQLSPARFDTQTENAGSSHLYGVEMELRHRPSDRVSYYATLGSVVTRFDDFVLSGPGTTANLTGKEFANAPRWSAGIGSTWRFDDGLFLDVNANYQSAAYDRADAFGGGPNRPIDGRTLVNVKTGWEGEKYGVYVTAQNLFDEKYVVATDFGVGRSAYLGRPRTIGFSLEGKW